MSWVGHASSGPAGLWFPLPTVLFQRASYAPQILSLLTFCRLHLVWDVLGSCGVGGGDSQGSSLPFCYGKLADHPEHTAPGRGVYSSSSQLQVSHLREESSSLLTSLRLSAAGLILSVLSKCRKINGLSLSPSILSHSASHWNSKYN